MFISVAQALLTRKVRGGALFNSSSLFRNYSLQRAAKKVPYCERTRPIKEYICHQKILLTYKLFDWHVSFVIWHFWRDSEKNQAQEPRTGSEKKTR